MSDLLESLDDGVLTLTINRLEAKNTLNEAFSKTLLEAFKRAKANSDVRCVVVTGAGNIFCVGGDVGDQVSGLHEGEETNPDAIEQALIKMIRDGSGLFHELYHLPKPTIAVMPGAAAGAGLALALACDFRFCLDTAKLTTAFSRIGLSCDSGMSYFLPKLVGGAKARELCFMADVITGQDAYEFGLVTKVSGRETFDADALAFTKRIANLPTIAISYMKETLIAAEQGSLQDIINLESERVVQSMSTQDHKNAAAAFMKKERAIFEGR